MENYNYELDQLIEGEDIVRIKTAEGHNGWVMWSEYMILLY